jgi:hypothetical protein
MKHETLLHSIILYNQEKEMKKMHVIRKGEKIVHRTVKLLKVAQAVIVEGL